MSDYWQRLKRHPELALASAMIVFGPVAAATSEHGDWRIGLIASVCWIPVLIAARK